MLNYHQLREQSRINRTRFQQKQKELDRILGIFLVVFLAALLIAVFIPKAHADEADFQAIKAQVAEQIKGTGATLSEFTPSKLTADDVLKIAKARKQLEAL